jgi:hypothetical protein
VGVLTLGWVSIAQSVKNRLQRPAGSRFLFRKFHFIGLRGIFPELNYPTELVFVVQHVIAVSDLPCGLVLDMDPFAGIARLS